MNPVTRGPLSGLKILEFGQIAAGPFAGSLLADLGAAAKSSAPSAHRVIVRFRIILKTPNILLTFYDRRSEQAQKYAIPGGSDNMGRPHPQSLSPRADLYPYLFSAQGVLVISGWNCMWVVSLFLQG